MREGDDSAYAPVKALSLETTTTLTVGTNLTVTGGQIVFPATQAPSSNANTLDDYEENTWTITPNTNLTLTATANIGRYIKVGKVVHFWVGIVVDTVSGTDTVTFSLPFTADAHPSNCNADAVFPVWGSGVDWPGDFHPIARIAGGASVATIDSLQDNGTIVAVTNAALAATDIIRFSGSYVASA